MTEFVSYFKLFTTRLRLSKPWNYKVPLLLAFPYLFVLQGHLENDEFIILILASLLTIIGFAGMAYTFNDVSDIKKDLAAQKNNAFNGRSSLNIKATFLFFLLLTLAPWYFLPFDATSILLIGLELLLFYLYSFPPIRLKERGALGLIVDALYAHVIPALLACHTFSLAIETTLFEYKHVFFTIIAWQFFSGLRNILSHQIIDLDSDIISNTRTWVAVNGLKTSLRLIKALIVLEVIGFLLFLISLVELNIYILAVYMIYMIVQYFAFAKAKQHGINYSTKEFTNRFLDYFYIKWIPILILLQISTIPTVVSGVLLIHLILFPNFIKNLLLQFTQYIKNHWLSYRLYHSLYNEKNYLKKLVKHLLLILLYTGVFTLLYYIIDSFKLEYHVFFYFQNLLSKGLIILLVLHAASFFIFNKRIALKNIQDFIFQQSTAYNLALFRILFFAFSILNLIGPYVLSLKAWTYLPKSSQVALPGIGWLMEIIPVSPQIYQLMIWLSIALSIMAIFGLKTKWVLRFYIPVAFYIWAVPCFYGKLNHTQIMLWIPIILAFSPCSDVLSLDNVIRNIKKKSSAPLKSIKYGFPLAMIWLHLGIIYCFSGFHKLWDTGLYWALSDNIINQIQLEWVENYDVILGYRVDKFPVLLKIGALLLILFEITYPIFLLKPLTRWINFIGAWSIHLTAGALMNIDFVNLRFMHFSLINWSRIKLILKKKNIKASLSTDIAKNQDQLSFTHIYKKSNYIVPLLLLGINIFYGFVGINSWPFSAYPAYSGIVKDEISIIKMEVFNQNNELIDAKTLGKEQSFRWENIRPFEERIAASYEEKDTELKQKDLEKYWSLWSNNVEGLEDAKVVYMYLEKTKIAPELRTDIISSVYLGKITTN
jgi:hypothetical protein